jgi:alpha-tubulin suppressor-like RCC1 family protein
VPVVDRVRALAAGGAFTCVLALDGAISCTGSNAHGELGDGTTADRLALGPGPVIAGAAALACGGTHACALDGRGAVWCWGENTNGQLGDGTSTGRHAPVRVEGLPPATAIAAGIAHTCALVRDGTVQCWGGGGSGQLGDGDVLPAARPTPAPVVGVSRATAIASRSRHGCALRDDGAVLCWGDGGLGQLGDGTTEIARTARESALGPAIAIGAGLSHTCAIAPDGRVRCAGDNVAGQLGTAAGSPALAPVVAEGIAGAFELAAGNLYTCVLFGEGDAFACMGDVRFLGEGAP